MPNFCDYILEVQGNFRNVDAFVQIMNNNYDKLHMYRIFEAIPDRQEDIIFNIREFGEFELNIPLKVQDFRINQTRPKKGYPKIINGIFCVQYELAPKGEEIKVIASDEEL